MRGARRLGRCPSTPLARHLSGRRRGAQLHRGGPAPRPHPVGGLADDWPARAAVRPDADRPQAEAAGLDRRRHGAMRSGRSAARGGALCRADGAGITGAQAADRALGLINSAFRLLTPALGVLRLHADQLSILSGLTDAHRQGLLNRSLDISIATDAIEDVDGLERYPILEKPYILLLPRGWRDNGAIDLARFAAELPFIRYTERRAADRALSAAPAPQSRPARPMMQRRAWRRWSRRGSAGPRCASATCRRPRTRSDARRCRRRGSPAI